jgi:hypothetical protein
MIWFVITLALLTFVPLNSYADSVPLRVEDPSGSHCIDATSEDITLHVRRVFTEKTSGVFTEDNHAAVIVTAKMTAGAEQVESPSVTLVSIKDERDGRISLPLEYSIASYLHLAQDKKTITEVALIVSLAKTRDSNAFGEIIEVASKALSQLPIPPNPYSLAASKLLAFANDAIADQKKKKLDEPIAQLLLAFNKGKETDLNKCHNKGKERTGVIALLQDKGAEGKELVPITNTEKDYCFKYSSANTYELLAAKRREPGKCPTDADYKAVYNDYVMFILSANTSGKAILDKDKSHINESSQRCKALKLDAKFCGIKN